MKTPTTRSGLKKYDHLPKEEAVTRAWEERGTNPLWHEKAQREVGALMPLLARALNRNR